jgi:hypothetical protein
MAKPTDTATREYVPAPAVLDRWAAHPWRDGVQVDAVPPLQAVEVCTRNTTYHVLVIDGSRGEVVVTGGRFFPTATRARLNGSTMGGSLLKARGIYCGFRLELQIGSQVILTTRVVAVALEPADVATDIH